MSDARETPEDREAWWKAYGARLPTPEARAAELEHARVAIAARAEQEDARRRARDAQEEFEALREEVTGHVVWIVRYDDWEDQHILSVHESYQGAREARDDANGPRDGLGLAARHDEYVIDKRTVRP